LAEHYTWFLAFPTAYHPMMVVFPKFVLNNPIYLISVYFWMSNLLKPPFWDKLLYKFLFFVSCMMMIPIVMLWWGNCMSEFKWEDNVPPEVHIK
jgi:hypothetical protein